jgi:hypothetical protein
LGALERALSKRRLERRGKEGPLKPSDSQNLIVKTNFASYMYIRERPVEINVKTENDTRGVPFVLYYSYLIPEKYNCILECYHPEIIEFRGLL